MNLKSAPCLVHKSMSLVWVGAGNLDSFIICYSFMCMCSILGLVYVPTSTCDLFCDFSNRRMHPSPASPWWSPVKHCPKTVPIKSSGLYSLSRESSYKTHTVRVTVVSTTLWAPQKVFLHVVNQDRLIVHLYSCQLADKAQCIYQLFFNREHSLSTPPLIFPPPNLAFCTIRFDQQVKLNLPSLHSCV